MIKTIFTTLTIASLGLNANVLEDIKGKVNYESSTFDNGSYQGDNSMSGYIALDNILNRDLTVGFGFKQFTNEYTSDTLEYNINTHQMEYLKEDLKTTEAQVFGTYTLNRFINLTGKLTNQTTIDQTGEEIDSINNLKLLTYITKYSNIYYNYNITDGNTSNFGIEMNKSFRLFDNKIKFDTTLGTKYQYENNMVLTNVENEEGFVFYANGKFNFKLKKDVSCYLGIHWDNENKNRDDFKGYFGISYKF